MIFLVVRWKARHLPRLTEIDSPINVGVTTATAAQCLVSLERFFQFCISMPKEINYVPSEVSVS